MSLVCFDTIVRQKKDSQLAILVNVFRTHMSSYYQEIFSEKFIQLSYLGNR